MQIITHDFVLKMFWLKLHNLNVNWGNKTIKLKKCECVIDIQFTHRQRSMTNKQHELNFVKYSTTIKNNLRKRFALTNIERNQSNQEVKNEEENYAFSKNLDKSKRSKDKRRKLLKKMINLKNILEEYKIWKHLFQEEVTIKVLFKHQSWNHEIKFESRK